jgi:hypothetical protein
MAGTWQRLAHVELSSSGDSLDTGTFTAKKYLWVQIKRYRTGSVNSRIRVNGDSGSNYAHRYSGGANSYSESTSTTQTSIYSHAATSNESLTNYFITNKADKEKLMIIEEVNGGAAGAGNAPARAEVVAKWTNTSDQITSIQCVNTDSGDLTSGTYITVFGASDDVITDEKTTLTNVPVNTRYEETDTRKMYRAGSVEPVFHYKFDEASGNVINHGSVADADLTVSGLTRDVSTPSGIGNGMSAPSNNSGDYAQNTSRINDYKFMHDGTTKWSVSFWLNLTSFAGSSSWTETYFFGNVWTDDNGIGWVIRTAYQSASVGKLQVFIANNTSSMPLNHSQSDMIPELNAWHHYTVTYDPTASSNQLTMTRDAATSGTGFAQSSTDNENWSTANPTRKTTFFARPTSSYDGGMAGKLAQVIIWKGHILTADEKTALYASGNGTTTLPSPLEWKERGSA